MLIVGRKNTLIRSGLPDSQINDACSFVFLPEAPSLDPGRSCGVLRQAPGCYLGMMTVAVMFAL